MIDQLNLIPTTSYMEGIPPFQFTDPDDIVDNKLRRYSELATKHAPTEVLVGEVVSTWEDYIALKVYVTMEWPVQTPEYTGTQRTECFISASSLTELSRVTTLTHIGRTMIANRESKEIIAGYYFY